MRKSIHTVVWFEIPVKDIVKASQFYEEVFDFKMHGTEEMGPLKMAILPAFGKGDDLVHGALVEGPEYEPGSNGTLVYFNGGTDLSVALGRVEAAGGKILQDKMPIGEHGFCAMFQDLDGNKLGIHSMS